MKKKYIVKSNLEFNNILTTGDKYKSEFFYIYKKKNAFLYNRYGIAVSKRIGNAVKRNKLKRQIKDVIDNISIKNIESDFILVAKGNVKTAKYRDLKEDIIAIYMKIGAEHEKK